MATDPAWPMAHWPSALSVCPNEGWQEPSPLGAGPTERAYKWAVIRVQESGRRRPSCPRPAVALDIMHPSFLRHRPGLTLTLALPCPSLWGALPTALCTLMTSKHFHSCPPGGQVGALHTHQQAGRWGEGIRILTCLSMHMTPQTSRFL